MMTKPRQKETETARLRGQKKKEQWGDRNRSGVVRGAGRWEGEDAGHSLRGEAVGWAA